MQRKRGGVGADQGKGPNLQELLICTTCGQRGPREVADRTREAFRARGLKVTPQRQLLFTLLDENTTHPTAEGLYAVASEQLPGISLRTVYTALTDLVDMGEPQSVAIGSGATRFDPNIDDHHHGVCDTCGSIIDLYVDGSDSLVVEADDRFTPRSASIVFHGTCATCAVDPAHRNPSHINPPQKEDHHG